MFVWWRDVIDEAQNRGDHTPVVQLGMRYGMALFIASEVMFFVAWFWAFFDASIYPGGEGSELIGRTAHTGGVWPPEGTEVFDPWGLPFLNTLILLTSRTTRCERVTARD
jgi:cytochrome c oxidase subunit 3